MNRQLCDLADVVRHYPYQEKLLLVPALSNGHQLLESMAREGIAWLNLRLITPLGLAAEVLEENTKMPAPQLMGAGQTRYILDSITAGMDQRGELVYFKALYDMGVLSRVLMPVAADWRSAMVDTAAVVPEQFVSQQKGKEICSIMKAYESALGQNSLFDSTALFVAAGQYLDQDLGSLKNKMLLIPQQLEFSLSAYDFIKRIRDKIGLVLAEEAVVGLDTPFSHRFEVESSSPAESALSCLYAPSRATAARPDIEMFQAYGESNEVREVLRRLKSRGIPLDQALLCYTQEASYLPLIQAEAACLEMPVTYASGIPVLYTRPGRLFKRLLDWLDQDYPLRLFYQILTEGDSRVPKAAAAARILRESGIARGREHYLNYADRMRQELEGNLQPAADPKRIDRIKRELEDVLQLKELLHSILDALPAPDSSGKIDFPVLCRGLSDIMQAMSRVGSANDGPALAAILYELAELGRGYPAPLESGQAIELLGQTLAGLSVGGGSAQPGHLHVARIEDARWINRPYTFVLGMDVGRLEGRGMQDPLLLDCEREVISDALNLKGNEYGRRLYRMVEFLASRRGHITLSFSSYDIVENRIRLASSQILQVFRLLIGDEGADYSRLGAWLQTAAYIPAMADQYINETEWWLTRALSTPGRGINQTEVTACFPSLKRGLQAVNYRYGPGFTEYDGRITAPPAEFDPRLDPKRTLSATTLESMAKCPFAYFLQYILKIEVPPDMQPDSMVWLDAMQRGSLLHSIYCKYQRQTYGAGQAPDKASLLAVAAKEIDDMQTVVTPPDELVFQLEKESIFRGLDVFWRLQEQMDREKQSLPRYFEVPFGLGDDEVARAGLGLGKPVEITLPTGASIFLRGKIDRIDQFQTAPCYQIWDFKTGGTFGYSPRDFVKKGRQLQHLLYSIAAEQILQQVQSGPVVKQAGYLFPAEKGEGQRIVRDQSRRDYGLQAVDKLLDLVGSGVFCATNDKSSCTYCDYRLVCRFPAASEVMGNKLENGANPSLKMWEVLQTYE